MKGRQRVRRDLRRRPAAALAIQEYQAREKLASEAHAIDYPYDQTKWPGTWRLATLEVTQSKIFDGIIIVVILLNCVFIAITTEISDDDPVMYAIGTVFFVIFLIEMLMKWFAQSLFGKPAPILNFPGGYFRNGWDRLDFIIVATSVMSLFPGVRSFNGLRVLRVLRPLRTVNQIKGLKIMVNTLLKSMTALTNVLTLIMFLLIVFGILSLQLFNGDFHARCYHNETDLLYSDRICTMDTASDFGWHCPSEYTCLPKARNPADGLVSFDSILHSVLTLYQNMTLTDWTKTMYPAMDSFGWIAAFIFCMLVLSVSFFGINLVLAVIFDSFGKAKDEANEHEEEEKRIAAKIAAVKSRVKKMQVTGGLADMKEFMATEMEEQQEEEHDKQETDRASFLFKQDNPSMKRVPPSPKHTRASILLKKERIGLLRPSMDGKAPAWNDPVDNVAIIDMPDIAEELVDNEEDEATPNQDDDAVQMDAKHDMDPVVETNATNEETKAYTSVEFTTSEDDRPDDILLDYTGKLPAAFTGKSSAPAEVELTDLNGEHKVDLDTFATASTTRDGLAPNVAFGNDGLADGDPNIKKVEAMVAADKNMSVWAQVLTNRQLRKEQKIMVEEKDKLRQLVGIASSVIKNIKTELEVVSTYLRDKPAWVKELYSYVSSPKFDNVVGACIMINTVALAMDSHNINKDLQNVLEGVGLALTVLFAIEMVLKLIVYGFKGYVHDRFNIFDGIVVIISIVEAVVDSGSSGVQALRAFRLFRVLKLARRLRSLQLLMISVVGSLKNIYYMSLLMLLFVFIFGITGVQLFGGVYDDIDWEPTTRSRFDSLYWSMITVFQVLTADDWPNVMSNLYRAAGPIAVVFMLVLSVFGSYVIMNLFVSIILDSFQSRTDEAIYQVDMRVIALKWIRDEQDKHYGQHKVWSVRIPPHVAITDVEDHVVLVMRKQVKAEHEAIRERVKARNAGLSKQKECVGTSLNLFPETMGARKFIFKMVTSDVFEVLLSIIILLSCLALAFEHPRMTKSERNFAAMTNNIFTVIFFIEFILKVFAFGFIKGKESYLSDNWNRIDGFVVLVSILSLAFPQVSFLRALRALRPLRVIIRSKKIKIVVHALFNAIPAIGNVVGFCALMWLIFGILGVNLFKGRLYYCNDVNNVDIKFKSDCIGTYIGDDGLETPRLWVNKAQNFDDIGASIRALFQVATGSAWNEIMYSCVDITDVDKVPKEWNHPEAAIFFIVFMLVCSFFTLNLFVGVVINTFNKLKSEYDGSALLSQEQTKAKKANFLINALAPAAQHEPSDDPMLRRLFFTVMHPYFERFISTCIIINTCFMMTEYYKQPDEWTQVLLVANNVFIVIFALEAAAKIAALTWTVYWSAGWNRFDFVLVVVSFIGYFIKNGAGLNVIRVFRIGRLMRLIHKAKTLEKLFNTLVNSIPALGNIGALIIAVFFVFAVFAVEFFGNVNNSQIDGVNGLTVHANFRTFPMALLTLYRASTGDSWHEIMVGSMLQPDSGQCTHAEGTCGHVVGASIFFLTFMVIGALVMVNLYIAVILENFTNDEDSVIAEGLEVFKEYWSEYDPMGSEIITPLHLVEIFKALPPPFGVPQGSSDFWMLRKLRELHIPIFLQKPHGQSYSFAVEQLQIHSVKDGFGQRTYHNHPLDFNLDPQHSTLEESFKTLKFFRKHTLHTDTHHWFVHMRQAIDRMLKYYIEHDEGHAEGNKLGRLTYLDTKQVWVPVGVEAKHNWMDEYYHMDQSTLKVNRFKMRRVDLMVVEDTKRDRIFVTEYTQVHAFLAAIIVQRCWRARKLRLAAEKKQGAPDASTERVLGQLDDMKHAGNLLRNDLVAREVVNDVCG